MTFINWYKIWRRTKIGHLILFIIQLMASYGFIDLSINNGNLLCYAAALTLLVWSIKNLILLIGNLIHGPIKH
jgi:hypothetical protein